jgi:DNA-binding response OmpR family regulator
MPRVLVVADASWARNEVHAALTDPDTVLVDHDDPATVADAVKEGGFDVVLVDLQVGSMGGMAVTRSVREAATVGGAPHVPVVIMLDRSADAFLARRAGAAAWIAKPFTSHEITTALNRALAGADGDGG